jgi:hypothetical protein
MVSFRRKNLFTLTVPKGNDIVILYSDVEYTPEEMRLVNAKIRQAHPTWTGLFLVFEPGQSIERIPEATARDIYAALKKRFEVSDAKPKFEGGDSRPDDDGVRGAPADAAPANTG